MTYIDLINRFWTIDIEAKFTGNETKLYFALLNVANQHFWSKKEFSIPNGRLLALIGCTKNTLVSARNKLMQYELIDYSKGNKRISVGKYTILGSNNAQQIDPKKEKKPFRVKMSQHIDPKPHPNTDPNTDPKPHPNTDPNGLANDQFQENTEAPKIRQDKIREDKIKEIIKEKEKIPETTKKVYDFFRDNFNNSEKMIQVLKQKEGLGDEFDLFMEYCLLDKGCGKYILEAKAPISYIKKIADVQWPHYQEWKGKKHKEAIDIEGLRAFNLSNAYHG